MVNDSGLKVSEIATASEQQAAQTMEVLQSIETISAAAAEDLNNTVSVFKIR